jgi:cell division protein FtsB
VILSDRNANRIFCGGPGQPCNYFNLKQIFIAEKQILVDLAHGFLRLYKYYCQVGGHMAVPHSKKAKPAKPKKAKIKGASLALLKKMPGGKLVWVLLLLMTCSMGGWLLFGNKGLFHLFKIRQERERLLQTNLNLKDENERLVKIIDRLQHDQEFIEDTIRKELNFIKKNEVIYQLEPEVGSGPRVTQAPALGPVPSPAKHKRTGRL